MKEYKDFKQFQENLSKSQLKRWKIKKCVSYKRWQTFRRSLKGLPTSEKLVKLKEYQRLHSYDCGKVQVQNYLNTLRRAGQL